MTKLKLEDNLINYKRGHVSLETMIAIVEAYSSASNDGKPIVMRSVCPKCGDTGRCEPRTLADPDGQECDCGQTDA